MMRKTPMNARSKTPRCKSCREKFTLPSDRPSAEVCSADCAIALTLKKRQKAIDSQRKKEFHEDRERKEKLKSKSDWIKETQVAVNAYVRFRDVSAGYGCIDCGKPFEPSKPGGSVDAGHFLSRGSSSHLRFDADRNIFAQRKNCNRPGGATREAFRAGVIARIGLEAVEALEADNEPRHYTIEDLRNIRDTYRAKLRELKKEKS